MTYKLIEINKIQCVCVLYKRVKTDKIAARYCKQGQC